MLQIAKLIARQSEVFFSVRSTNRDLLGEPLVNVNVIATRAVTLQSLLLLWRNITSHGRLHKTKGKSAVTIKGDLETVDIITGVQGFGKAMAAVCWLIHDKNKDLLGFPNFLEHTH